MKYACPLVLSLTLLGTAIATAAEKYPVTPPPASLKLKPFYTKYTHANGYPIVASKTVNDLSLIHI